MSPYSDLSNEELLAERESVDQYLKEVSEQLAWAEENDHESGLIDALRGDADHAVADYNWLTKEIHERGLI